MDWRTRVRTTPSRCAANSPSKVPITSEIAVAMMAVVMDHSRPASARAHRSRPS